MQTFLPEPDLKRSPRCLDNQRLGKQRVEVYQILRTICLKRKPWSNHPAVNMWRGYENCLVIYGLNICDEWINRGFRDSCRRKIYSFYDRNKLAALPFWFDDKRLHQSHQSNLLRKNPEYYSKFGWDVPDDLPYWWPV